MEAAAAECIPAKPRVKYRIPWETLAVWKKQGNVKTSSLCNKSNPTNVYAQKLKKARRERTNIYQKEQKEYIQSLINKTRKSEDDKQSQIAWQTVNEVSKKISTSRAKLQAASQERIQMWKEHFKNLLVNSPKVTEKPIKKFFNSKLDIQLRQFTQELNVELTKFKAEKL